MTLDRKKALGRGLESLLPPKSPAGMPGGIKSVTVAAEAEPVPAGAEEIMAAETAPTLAEAAHLKIENIQAATRSLHEHSEALDSKIGLGGSIVEIPLPLIARNPYQTRVTTPEDPGMQELAESIRVHGVMQPVVVRPLERPGPKGELYQLVAGERRWLASREAGKQRVPATVRSISDADAMVITIIENLHRQDLNPMQHARSFHRLMEEFRLTQEEVARRIGMPRSVVANYMRLTRLPDGLQQAIEEGRLSFGHAKVLLPLASTEALEICARKVLAGRLSVRETEKLVEEFLNPSAPQPKPERRVDPNVRAAEDELARSLGCRVRIRDRNGRGRIEIEYRSLEDFDRVLGALK
jgi:ParB family chromosome partitioning protein